MVNNSANTLDADDTTSRKLWKTVQDFSGYIGTDAAFIPNYGERYRYGEPIATAFVESTVNEVISRRNLALPG